MQYSVNPLNYWDQTIEENKAWHLSLALHIPSRVGTASSNINNNYGTSPKRPSL